MQTDLCVAEQRTAEDATFNQMCHSAEDVKWILLLDNQSACEVFCNAELLEGTHQVPKLMQATTNGGGPETNFQRKFGKTFAAWHHSKAIANGTEEVPCIL